MENIKIEIDSNFPEQYKKSIDELNKKNDFSPIWQSINWNLMNQKTRNINKWIFVWVIENEKLINFVIIEKRSVWFWKYWLFILWWPNNSINIELLEKEIIKIWKEEKVIFIQIESLVNIDYKLFKKWYHKKFIEKCTAVIDLKKSKEEILKDMKQKWRYNIKIAEKNNVMIEKKEKTIKNLDKFYDLLTETQKRDWFFINSKEYFSYLWDYIDTNKIWDVLFAEKENELIAAWIFTDYQNTRYYYYWASTWDNEKRKYMATYLLQWKAIKLWIEKWLSNYDFLWISCPDEKSKRLAWVTDFKTKLTPNIKKWPNARIFVISKPIFYILKLKSFIKNIIRW